MNANILLVVDLNTIMIVKNLQWELNQKFVTKHNKSFKVWLQIFFLIL